jgi:type VI secretion system protein ImpA
MLDTEWLLRPIRDDAPAGENLRDDPSPTSPYYQIKDARNTARSMERAVQQAEDPSASPAPDWHPVLELGPKLIGELSKDLEVAAWLIEAQLRAEGFPGLRAGFELARGLLETVWDGLHPRPDEEGILTRVAPLAGLNGDEAEGTLIVPIGMVPLLADDRGPLSTWHYQTAREIAAIADPELRQRRLEAGAVSPERFLAAVASTDPADLFARLDEVEACLREFDALSRTLDEKCGSSAPPTSSIRQALQDVLDCLSYLTKDLARPQGSDHGAAAVGGEGEAGASGRAAPAAPGVIASRRDAVESMQRVRDYFRQTEPHSPLSYLLDQALRWSQLPLHVLAAELIPDPSALASFQVRTGIPSNSPSDQRTDP